VDRGVVMPRGIGLTAHGIASVARGTGAIRGIEVDRGVVTPRGIGLTAHGIAAVARGTGAVHGTEAAPGVVTPLGIVLTARGTTVADVAVASAHSTGRHYCPCQVLSPGGGRIGVAFAAIIQSPPAGASEISLRHDRPKTDMANYGVGRQVVRSQTPNECFRLSAAARFLQVAGHCRPQAEVARIEKRPFNVKLRGAPLLARPSRTPCYAHTYYAHTYASTMSFFVLCINATSSSRSGCWILKASNVA